MRYIFNYGFFSNRPISVCSGYSPRKRVIWIHFPYNQELKNHLREHIHVHWSNTQKCWYAYDVEAYRKLFGLPEKEVGERVISQIHENIKEAFVQFRNLLKLKRYSANTLRTYLTEFGAFLVLLKQHKVRPHRGRILPHIFFHNILSLRDFLPNSECLV